MANQATVSASAWARGKAPSRKVARSFSLPCFAVSVANRPTVTMSRLHRLTGLGANLWCVRPGLFGLDTSPRLPVGRVVASRSDERSALGRSRACIHGYGQPD